MKILWMLKFDDQTDKYTEPVTVSHLNCRARLRPLKPGKTIKISGIYLLMTIEIKPLDVRNHILHMYL